jgi:predicted alpha/beta-fold hydrolase
MAGRAALIERLPPFRPLWPWIGGDLQTIRNWLVKPRPPIDAWPAQAMDFAMADGTGDVLHGILQQPHEATATPLILLVHGLTGSSESSYMRTSATALLRAGYPVLRLNLRGAGPGRGRTRSFYHAGRSEDLAQVIAALPSPMAQQGIVVVGYSLGANMVLKYLAEQGAAAPVLAGAAISPPIDLHAAQRRIAAPRNRLYHRNLLDWMLRERGPVVPSGVRTILDFDDRVVAPAHGFKDALEYYRACSAGPRLGAIRRPTLVIHGGDDPWIPAADIRAVSWSANPQLLPLIPSSGGHVGFHAAGLDLPWHDVALLEFLKTIG